MAQTKVLSITASAAMWEQRFEAAVTSYGVIILSAVALILLLLFGQFIFVSVRRRRQDAIRAAIMEAVKVHKAARAPETAKLAEAAFRKRLYTRRGLAVLAQTAGGMPEPDRKALRGLLRDMGFIGRVEKLMETDNEDFLIELVSLAGDLGFKEMDEKVAALLYAHKDNVELQFQCFLVLSRLGSFTQLVRVCTDKDFPLALSFRSLQQVLTVFAGDKRELYSALLDSPDKYVVRIAIKQIGHEGMANLAPQVAELLGAGDENALIDNVRTLGALRYKPAADIIVMMLGNPKWEVRAVSATALASMDVNGYIPQLVKALQDSEWQVRYNAALGLQKAAKPDAVLAMVEASGDQYALEMYDYMSNTNGLWRKTQ